MKLNNTLTEFDKNIRDDDVHKEIVQIPSITSFGNLKNKKKSLGQNFTPQAIVDFMISLISKDTNSEILEPSAGKGIFIERLKNFGYKNIDAYEIDPTLCKSNSKIICKDFMFVKQDKKYDLVIGNPPYVRWKNLPERTRKFLLSSDFWNRRVNRLSDLLQTFIYKGVDMLKEGGELIFITPYFWVQSLHATNLRNFLINKGYFEEFIYFGEHKLFEDASTNFIIFRFVKSKEISHHLRFVELKDKWSNVDINLNKINKTLSLLKDQGKVIFDNIVAFRLLQFKTSKPWELIDPEISKRLNIYENNCNYQLHKENNKKIIRYSKNPSNSYLTFSDICRIGAGMVSGFDGAFKINDKFIERLNDKEKNKIIYFIKSGDMDRFFYRDKTPYIRVDDISQEEELRLNYPNLFERLNFFKDQLTERYDYGVKWYHYSFLRNIDIFLENPGPKLFVPSKDRKPYSRFVYVNKPFFCGQDSCVIVIKKDVDIKEDLKYLLALLNSNIINLWYRNKGIRRGDVLQYSFEPMSKIPIRLINWKDNKEVGIYKEIIMLVDEILKNKRYNEHIKKINEFVEYLYSH